MPLAISRVFAGLFLALAVTLPAAAQIPQLPLQTAKPPATAPIPLPPSNPSTPPALTAQDVTAFLDGFLPLQLQRDDVAGATVAIYQNGQPLILKGYGYADWKKKTPVDPVATTFRPGSISKPFVYVSMMQLVEQGKLNLDANIQQYLDFTIHPGPGTIGDKPITLRNLATHTAGFEEVDHDLGSDKSGKLPLGLRDYLIRNQPHRFADPGNSLAYSNYGISLIGYIVQRVSGEKFEDYVHNHIFAPLGMTHSTFAQPAPDTFARTKGYVKTSQDDTGFESFGPSPAGGLSSTAADMAIFGQMLLGQGTFNGHQILQPSSVAELLKPQFAPAPGITPWNLGFYTERRNGLDLIGHGGDLIACHSEFFIEKSHHLVFFISYNSAGAARIAREELIQAFIDRYLPGPATPHPAYLKLSQKDLAPYTGYYVSSRRSDSTKTRLLNIIDPREIASTKDGELTISTAKDLRNQPLKFHPIGNDSFYEESFQYTVHFERDSNGHIAGTDAPGHADRLPPYLTPRGLLVLVAFPLVTFLFIALAGIIRLYRRLFHRQRPSPKPQPGTIWLTAPIRIAAWTAVVVVIDVIIIATHVGNITDFFSVGHLDNYFFVQNVLSTVSFVAMVFAFVSGFNALRKPRPTDAHLRWITRLKFALATLSCAFFAWFLVYFHFIGSAHRY